MADSIGQSYKASIFGVPNKNKQGGVDTPEKREARLSLYAARASQVGPNGRPLNIFTGEEYTFEEVHGVTDEDDYED